MRLTFNLLRRISSAALTICCAFGASSFAGTGLAETTAKPAPACKLSAFANGQAYDLQQLKGKVLYLDFWASWCPPCAQSVPFLNGLSDSLHGQGLLVLGVNLDENPNDAAGFLAEHPATFAIATDPDTHCAEAFGVQAMPSSYLIDRSGNIRHELFGFRPGDSEQIRQWVEQLLAEPSR